MGGGGEGGGGEEEEELFGCFIYTISIRPHSYFGFARTGLHFQRFFSPLCEEFQCTPEIKVQ